MRQYLPYNVLFIVAISLTGLMIFYNLTLRETFAVTVAYKIPGIPQPKPVPAVSAPAAQNEDGEEIEDEWYDYDRASSDEEAVLTSVTFPLDINRATEEELRFIPQVGNVTAQRIVQYREVIGGYTSLQQLMEIKGIGDASFEKITAYLIIADQEVTPADIAEESPIETSEENDGESD